MNMLFKRTRAFSTALFLSLPLILLGCGGGSSGGSSPNDVVTSDAGNSDGSTVTPTEVSNTVSSFNGRYRLSILSTTQLSSNGGECEDATGLMILQNGLVSGTVVLSSSGAEYNITGNLASDGTLTGNFTNGGQNLGAVFGSIDGERARGSFDGASGCRGTWEANKTTDTDSGIVTVFVPRVWQLLSNDGRGPDVFFVTNDRRFNQEYTGFIYAAERGCYVGPYDQVAAFEEANIQFGINESGNFFLIDQLDPEPLNYQLSGTAVEDMLGNQCEL